MFCKENLGGAVPVPHTGCMRLAIVEVRAPAWPSRQLLVKHKSQDGSRTLIKKAARSSTDRLKGHLILYNASDRVIARLPLNRVMQIQCLGGD